MGKNGNAGRPEIEWGDKEFKQFETLCNMQCTQEEICSVMGVTDKTLMRLLKERYKDEFAEGEKIDFSEIFKKHSGSGKASLRRLQFKIAEGGNATMAIFLGKQYLGQKDQIETETPDTNINIHVSAAKESDIKED